jgi:hypothetical protein
MLEIALQSGATFADPQRGYDGNIPAGSAGGGGSIAADMELAA